jgi:2-oxo-4-hydroxy-4-carboxy--5-ureidoimidazoline (OHCU) decarboxylase
MGDCEHLVQELRDAIEHEDWNCAKSYAAAIKEHLEEGRAAMSEILGNKKVKEAFSGNHIDCACRLCAALSWLADAEAALS